LANLDKYGIVQPDYEQRAETRARSEDFGGENRERIQRD